MEPPDVFVLCVLFVMLVVSLSVLAAGEVGVQAKRNRRRQGRL